MQQTMTIQVEVPSIIKESREADSEADVFRQRDLYQCGVYYE